MDDVTAIEFGIDTFGDRPEDDAGVLVSHAEGIRQVVAEAVLADDIGLDVIAVGEHHRPEYTISAPEVVLAGIATRTSRIRLASGVNVYPKTESGRLRTWVGVGGSPQSVVRTAHYGFPLMLAIIGGSPERFAPYVELYRRAAEKFGTTAHPVGVHSPGFVADTDEQARELHWPRYQVMRDRIGAERGWPPVTLAEYESEIAHGSLYVGSPETVARKVATTIRALDAGRFDLIYTFGAQPTSARLRAVELYGTTVVPMVRDLLADA